MNRHPFYYCLRAMLTGWQAVPEAPKSNVWGAMTNNAQLSIRLKGDRKELKVNQAFSLLVGIKNLSTNQTLILSQGPGEMDLKPGRGR
jgi:hypothetical protein